MIDTIKVEVVRVIQANGRWEIHTTVTTSDGEKYSAIKDVDPAMFDMTGYWGYTWNKLGEELKRLIKAAA
jgi:hypothetical protein